METLARVLQLLGAAALLGSLAVGDEGRPGSGRFHRASALFGALALVAGGAIDLLRLGASLSGSAPLAADAWLGAVAVARSTAYGRLLLVRWLFGIGLAALIAAGGGGGRAVRAGRLALAAALAIALGAGGHAQTGARPWLAVPVQALHTAAAAAWFGGLVQLAALAAGRSVPTEVLARLAGRFSRFGLAAMALLALSGGALALARLFSPYDLLETNYGMRLGLKLAWVASVLALAAVNRFAIVPRTARGVRGARRVLRVGLAAEAVLGLGVLALAANLAVTPPPLGPADRHVVRLGEYRFEPAEITVRAGRVARVVVINDGGEVHDWTVPEMPYAAAAVAGGDPHDHGEGIVHVHVRPGGRAAVDFIPLRPGRYRLLCTVGDHSAQGMVGWVVVTE